jgi:flagellar basal-body rod protein FlgB
VSINFEKALGSAERALIYRSQRAEVLSNNIANADTPNFKARDLDFSLCLPARQKKACYSVFFENNKPKTYCRKRISK